MASDSLVNHLVVDAVGFMKAVRLEKIGRCIYTIKEVINEIKDSETKRHLQMLPYELILSEPDNDSLHIMTVFSKKTGDYASLSVTDLKLLALTYMLEKNKNGIDHLRTEPVVSKVAMISNDNMQKDKISGFFTPKPSVQCLTVSSGQCDKNDMEHLKCLSVNEKTVYFSEESAGEKDKINDCVSEGSEVEHAEQEEWITEDNIEESLAKTNSADIPSLDHVQRTEAACLTADFAMQNVLLHMGLGLRSTDGCVIRRLNSYVLRCRSCFATTSIMTKNFCARCGNKSLLRCAVSISEGGSVIYHLSKRKPPSVRGLKHSLPMPKGGKHGADPILFEDQPIAQNRLSRKALCIADPISGDFVNADTPFVQKDVTSRSARLGFSTHHKVSARNPNSAGKRRKRGGKKR